MIRPISTSLLLYAALTADAIGAENPGLRLAVAHVERIFEAHPKTKQATQTLTEAQQKLRDEFKQQADQLKQTLQRHQELIRAGKRKEAEECLAEANLLERKIATLKTQQERDLHEQFLQAKTQILSDIREAIQSYNRDNRYALILDISTLPNRHGLSPILDAPAADDITEELIKQLQAVKATPIE